MLTIQAQQWPPGLPSPKGHMEAGLAGVPGQQGVEVVGVLPVCSQTKSARVDLSHKHNTDLLSMQTAQD